MTILIFIRHGETAWSKNQEHRVRGRIDIQLNQKGFAQAQAAGEHLKAENLIAIYSSPLKRAIDTAAEIAEFQGLPVIKHQGFIDINFGDWQGKTHKSIDQDFPELSKKWKTEPQNFQFPNGEDLDLVRKRIKNAILDLIDKHYNDKVLISTHGAVLRVILCYLHQLGNEHYWEYRMDNCALTIAEFKDNRIKIIIENDKKHLKNIQV